MCIRDRQTSLTDGTPWDWLDWGSPDVRAEAPCLLSSCCIKVPIGANAGGFCPGETTHLVVPRVGAGDRLWVREAFNPHYFGVRRPGYRADWNATAAYFNNEPKWKPSIHMPRWASRLTLEVTGVRAERVQEISYDDARAEGINGGCGSCGRPEPCGCPYPLPDPPRVFRGLWNSINAARGYGWDVNPWVWCVSFRRVD